jgi:hypothetical protein
VVPDAVDRGVDLAAAREIGECAIEFADRKISMSAPSQKQRVVRLDFEPARERRDRLPELPCTRFGDAQVDDACDVLRVGRERGSRALDGIGLRQRPILHALGRPVLHRRRADLAGTEYGPEADRRDDD